MDSERGARIALDVAVSMILQPSLFGDDLPLEFWQEIESAANDQLDDAAAYRAAVCVREGIRA